MVSDNRTSMTNLIAQLAMTSSKCINNIPLAGNIPDYSVIFPRIQKLLDKEKRNTDLDDEEIYVKEAYVIEGLPTPDIMVTLEHNTKLLSPGYGFSTCQLSVCA